MFYLLKLCLSPHHSKNCLISLSPEIAQSVLSKHIYWLIPAVE